MCIRDRTIRPRKRGEHGSGRSIGSGPRWPIGAPGGFLMPGCPDAWIARMAKIARMAEFDCPDARMAKIARIPMASGHGQWPWPAAMASGHGQWPWPVAMGIRATLAIRAPGQSNSAIREILAIRAIQASWHPGIRKPPGAPMGHRGPDTIDRPAERSGGTNWAPVVGGVRATCEVHQACKFVWMR